jgi:hypothetical protein
MSLLPEKEIASSAVEFAAIVQSGALMVVLPVFSAASETVPLSARIQAWPDWISDATARAAIVMSSVRKIPVNRGS